MGNEGQAENEDGDLIEFIVEGEDEGETEGAGKTDAEGDKQQAADGDKQTDGDDDEDGDDERLGANESDTEDEITANAARKKKRREMQRRAREAKDAELAELRAFKAAAEPRLDALEKNAIGVNTLTIEGRLSQARNAKEQAEAIRIAAEKEGNVSDALEAIRIRDAAVADIAALEPALAELRKPQAETRPQQSNPGVDMAAAWQKANGWYNDAGMDDASVITRTIAAQMTKEGHQSNTLAYWQELTRRVEDTGLVGDGIAAKPDKAKTEAEDKPAKTEADTRRKAPPTGTQRGNATGGSGNNQFHLSAERKQAIIDAGKWDDPVERNRMVKRYRDYDRQAAGQEKG